MAPRSTPIERAGGLGGGGGDGGGEQIKKVREKEKGEKRKRKNLKKKSKRGGEEKQSDERRHVGRVRGLNSRCSSPLHLTPSETRSRNATGDHGQVYGEEEEGGEACQSDRSVRSVAILMRTKCL